MDKINYKWTCSIAMSDITRGYVWWSLQMRKGKRTSGWNSANWNDRKEPNLKPYKIMFKGLHMKKHVRMLLATPTWLNHLYVRKEARMIPSGYSTSMENGPFMDGLRWSTCLKWWLSHGLFTTRGTSCRSICPGAIWLSRAQLWLERQKTRF